MSNRDHLISMSPPYKGPSGKYYTRQLFQEMHQEIIPTRVQIKPVFSFMEDKPGLINARTTFVELNDPTGYQWAVKYLHSWPHFQLLENSEWFKPFLERYREEIRFKLRSTAIQKLMDIARSDSSQAVTAAKYLASLEFDKETHRRGRPSKTEMDAEMKRLTQLAEEDQGALERMGLKVIDGGKVSA